MKVAFDSEKGHRLVGYLDRPVDDEPLAYALFAHCFTCTKNLAAAAHVSRALVAQGYAVLRFDFTGLGESEGDFADTSFSSNVDDLVAAAAFLEQEYEAPRLLVGHSFGGSAVLHAAERLPSVAAVATIAAPFDPEHVSRLLEDDLETIEATGRATVRLAGRPFTIRRDFLDDLRGRRTETAVARLKRALLILHAPLDQIVGIENAAHLFEAAQHPKSFVSLDDADHLLTDEGDARYAGAVLGAWARKYLPGPQEDVKYPDPEDNRIFVHTGAGGFRTDILANGHALVADEPVSLGGTNRGPTPYDYLAAALGACTSITLRMYADRKAWPLEGVTVRLRHQKIHARDCLRCETEEGRIDQLEREITLEGPLDAAQRARLIEIANRCPVHRTLESHIEVVTKEGAASGDDARALNPEET